MSKIRLTHAAWLAAAKERYGDKSSAWKFQCPSCGHVQCAKDFEERTGLTREQILGQIGFSCIGRSLPAGAKVSEIFEKPGPCNYTGGGLLRLNPIEVDADGTIIQVFDFADRPLTEEKPSEPVSSPTTDGAHQHPAD